MGRHMLNSLKNLGEIGAVFEAHAPAYRLNRFLGEFCNIRQAWDTRTLFR